MLVPLVSLRLNRPEEIRIVPKSNRTPPRLVQLRMAKKLGVIVPPGATAWQVGRLINAAPPTEEQLLQARELGIEVRRDEHGVGLQKRIAAFLEQASREAFDENPALRIGAQVLFEGKAYVVVDRHDGKWPKVSLQPLSGGKIRVLAAIKCADVREKD